MTNVHAHFINPAANSERSYFTTEAELVNAFQGSIEPVRISTLYKLGLLVVAMGMILLPLFYVFLIFCVGFAIYLHAVYNVWIMSGQANVVTFLIYLTPIVAGILLIMFMLKPLLARPVTQIEHIYLTPTEHPLAFHFIEELCSAIGSPLPSRIDVDCSSNASAGFRRGIVSFFTNDLVLTIGLPLVAVLDLRQLAGVLAHELGHFGQGLAMRLSYVIANINNWFSRMVYQRDEWDVKLFEISKEGAWKWAPLLFISRFFIWLTRKILWVLMIFGNMISCFMSRQMELDADRYLVRVAGEKCFEPLMKRLAILETASRKATYALQYSWREKKLVDDIPGLTVVQSKAIPIEVRLDVEENALQEQAGWFDTHPELAKRLQNARKENTQGIFHLEKPARCLFSNFKSLCQKASWLHFRYVIGLDVRPEMLLPLSEFVQQSHEIEEKVETQTRYFHGIISSDYPMQFSTEHIYPAKDPAQAAQSLMEARDNMRRNYPATLQSLDVYRQSFSRFRELLQAKAFLQLGFKIDSKDFDLDSATLSEAESAKYQALEQKQNACIRLDAFAEEAKTRLLCALQLLHHPEMQNQLDASDGYLEKIDPLFNLLVQLGRVFPLILKLEEKNIVLYGLLSGLEDETESLGIWRAIDRLCREMQPDLIRLQQELVNYQYPFKHARRRISVTEYAMEKSPVLNRPKEFYYIVRSGLDNLYILYNRLLGELCEVAEKVESVIDRHSLSLFDSKTPSDKK